MNAPQTVSDLDRNKKLILQWFEEVWNQGRTETISQLLDPACVIHDGPLAIRGPDEFKHFHDALHKDFVGFHIKPVVVLAEDDLVCLHWTLTCTHTGSNTPVTVTGTSIARVHDGRFMEAWQNWDAARLSSQLPEYSLPGFF
jgi:predicted SnoaL-like aldol condensation-catalyzing enzyme